MMWFIIFGHCTHKKNLRSFSRSHSCSTFYYRVYECSGEFGRGTSTLFCAINNCRSKGRDFHFEIATFASHFASYLFHIDSSQPSSAGWHKMKANTELAWSKSLISLKEINFSIVSSTHTYFAIWTRFEIFNIFPPLDFHSLQQLRDAWREIWRRPSEHACITRSCEATNRPLPGQGETSAVLVCWPTNCVILTFFSLASMQSHDSLSIIFFLLSHWTLDIYLRVRVICFAATADR